ncbi:nicotinic acid mononucleotide adenyltransferase [Seonamhaeicola sediminis]|uniref:Nicotinic acid mononucleotide adenyltransferase n=1 Tax=Seonamhaeicola sediminis TaxID=2528206 RepID=A0A562YAE0_9FLAO|nr:nicotinic acid mononucleotide adenyltransferase [Seonamhaeicola sediminis]TWO31391.1 nicotinic acid mononucleotide adenyltransferase [Seonamhaeicola sediminis]
MKKYILTLAILFIGLMAFAQENKNVTHEQKGDLIETTYFYADGAIQQQGTFNKAGKLHGTWTSFDKEGNKLAVGNYDNGKKVGKWTFWVDGEANEVDYVDSKMTKVTKANKENTI